MELKKYYPHLFTLLFFITLSNAWAQQTVSTTSELLSAVKNVKRGTTINIANGTYKDVSFAMIIAGTASEPVIIRALNPGSVFFEGESHLKFGGSYITLEGIVFQNSSGLSSDDGKIDPIIRLRFQEGMECNHCTITNIKIDSFNGNSSQKEDNFKWIQVFGQHNEISYSSFIGKNGIGSVINANRDIDKPDYLKIHHNYFADRTEVRLDNNRLANDLDAIRIGYSGTSKGDSFSEVHHNFFENWIGEVEIISNKSGENKYYNNTFRDSRGTLTLRHGTDCEVYGNYFLADNTQYSGGIRIMDAGHLVYNNYMEGLNSYKPGSSEPSENVGAINLSNGQPNSDLDEYFEAKDIVVINNTIVDCDFGIRVGSSVNDELTVAPEDVVIANNVIVNSGSSALLEQKAPKGTSLYAGNLNQDGSWDLSNDSNNNRTVSSDILSKKSGLYRLTSNSEAIDAAQGEYSFLTKDILDGLRSGKVDVGAEEYGANGTRAPYTTSDVGETIGFGASAEDYLNVSTLKINFTKLENNTSFVIDSDLDWTIDENATWLSLSTTNGSQNRTITVTATENNSQEIRTAEITITGSNNSQTIINVIQSSGFSDPNESTILDIKAVTALGTEEDKDNVPENTIDGTIGSEDGTYWAASSDSGNAHITYDLGCLYRISKIGIAFLKGEDRQYSFKIAISPDNNSYTEVSELVTSSGNTLNFEDFLVAPNSIARYVRILGYGNSSNSWNSYTEVQVYGAEECTTLGISENTLSSKGLVLYPIPAKDKLQILSKNQENIGWFRLFDLNGRLLRQEKINALKATINLGDMVSGLYLVNIEDSFGTLMISPR